MKVQIMATFGLRVACQFYRCLQISRIEGQRNASSLNSLHSRLHRKKINIKQNICWELPLTIKSPEFDWSYLSDRNNLSQIKNNIERRKGIGDIDTLQAKWKELKEETCEKKQKILKEELNQLAAAIPNSTSDLTPTGDESQAFLLEKHGDKKEFTFKTKSHVQVGHNLGLLRTENLPLTTGRSTYYLCGDLAQMEQALVQYTLQYLLSLGFNIVTVPDIIHPSIIEGCGFKTTGTTNQVYRLDNHDMCLAGTAEMPLSGYFMNSVFNYKDLPKKVCAVSRCYRAETSTVEVDKGIYRVHQFTKVEMFGITRGSSDLSSKLMEEFMSVQTQLFNNLGLHFRVLEMPTQELGAPAYRKVDMEAWMPNTKFWGEISSTSDCTDFQSRRLGIKYQDEKDQLLHTHTVNGTACAVPRLIMNILETNQTSNGDVIIPSILQPWMNGKEKLQKLDKSMTYIKANRLYKMKK